MWGHPKLADPTSTTNLLVFQPRRHEGLSHCLTSPYSAAQMNIIHATGMPDRARICREPSGEYLKSG
jgi:hypothetical protein